MHILTLVHQHAGVTRYHAEPSTTFMLAFCTMVFWMVHGVLNGITVMTHRICVSALSPAGQDQDMGHGWSDQVPWHVGEILPWRTGYRVRGRQGLLLRCLALLFSIDVPVQVCR